MRFKRKTFKRGIVKSRSLYTFLVILILSSLGLSGCQAAQSAQAQPNSAGFSPSSVVTQDCSRGNQIREITAVDRHTVKFVLCEPDRTFPFKVGSPAFSIQDDAVLAETQGDPAKLTHSANGTGPFKVIETVLGKIRLEKRETYWGVPVRLRNITILWNESRSLRRTNLSVRSVDGISAVDPEDVNSIRLDSYLKVVESPVISTVYLGMNNTIAPFDKVEVRQALGYAFDRQKIASAYFGPSALAADQFIPPAFEIGHTNALRWHDYNFKQTSDLLRLANYDFEKELLLTYDENPSSLIPKPNDVALELVLEMRNAGIKVELNPLKTAEFKKALGEGKVGLYFAAFTPDYPDANSFFETFFMRDNLNIGKTDPDVTSEIKASLASSDPKVIQAHADYINQWIKQQVPLIPLAHVNDVYGFRQMVGSIIIGPLNENYPTMTTTNQNLNFMQAADPGIFWPVDFSSPDTLRVTRLIFDSLTAFDPSGLAIQPGLADSWSSNTELTEWTFNLRYDVVFENGAILDANDVVATFAAQADAANPNHRANLNYDYFRRFFGNFINAKP